jgi:hypothetical protein
MRASGTAERASEGRRIIAGSVARVADFEANPPNLARLPRDSWATGDYVAAEVLETGEVPCRVETVTGRIARIAPGGLVLGALGSRAATLEAVGDWRGIGEDGVMQQLTAACVFGRCSSLSQWTHPLADLRYRGHATRDGDKLTMRGFVAEPSPRVLEAPVVLIVGTSMDAGKTVVGKEIIRMLKRRGLRVAGAKLTGVGRLQDILAFEDAGADYVTDFLEVGLPSTVVPAADYEQALHELLAKVAAVEPDVLVAEAGASPLEPYNGEAALRLMEPHLGMLVVCASDPYAVAGVVDAFDRRPDLVSGRAASTDAGIALVERLTGLVALNVLERGSQDVLDRMLEERLGLEADPSQQRAHVNHLGPLDRPAPGRAPRSGRR